MYSHDGLKDSLTNLAAPPLFYEELRRELSRARRNNGEVLVVRLLLQDFEESAPEVGCDVDQLSGKEDEEPNDPEREILEFSQILKGATRGEDVCSRVGEREFLTLFQGEILQPEPFISRLNNIWTSKQRVLTLLAAFTRSISGEGGLELLNRLDLEPMARVISKSKFLSSHE